MSEFRLSPRARADLTAIWEYIADDNLNAANRVLDRIHAACIRIGRSPGIGHTREDLTNRPVLFWLARPYLLVCHPDSRPIETIAVIHSARDLSAVLRDIGV